MTPDEVVSAQFEAYNDHDLARFAQCFASSVDAYDLVSHAPLLRSREELLRRYRDFFSSHPEVQARLLARVTRGAVVVDSELLMGLPENREAVVMYEVAGGLIQRFWVL